MSVESKPEILNAKITGTQLGPEDHGIFTCFVTLEGSGWGCGFGGYAFDSWSEAEKARVGAAFGIEFIAAVLRIAESPSWEKLIGKFVRCESEGLGGKIRRLGHITKDEWFDPQALAEKVRRRANG